VSLTVLHGDCLEVLATLEADSLSACVTDPPYGLSFMGRGWDHGVPGEPFWVEVLRVLKPGAHIAAFGGTRTYHRLACAIEDAGFEIRDCMMWLYGSGFPKSLDVSKAIDKQHGHWRGRAGEKVRTDQPAKGDEYERTEKGDPITATATATAWQGWGTALKPAWEPIILARKPLLGTVASNVQEHGTGALNVDGCRIGGSKDVPASPRKAAHGGSSGGVYGEYQTPPTNTAGWDRNVGRWPANLLLDEEAAVILDRQSGELSSGSRAPGVRNGLGYHGADGDGGPAIIGSSGGASRFFYTSKASRTEREGSRHPTVKPLDLMRWLVRLVTPPGGTILDPFAGTGTTGEAALMEGFGAVLIEREAEYVADIEKRLRETQLGMVFQP